MTTKLELRPPIEITNLEISTPVELFQNQTLRPILKLQNEIYLEYFATYCLRQKPDFNSLKLSQKWTFTEHSLQKDLNLKNIFIGITIGMFTRPELQTYQLESKEYNKRIIKMLIERIKNQTKQVV